MLCNVAPGESNISEYYSYDNFHGLRYGLYLIRGPNKRISHQPLQQPQQHRQSARASRT